MASATTFATAFAFFGTLACGIGPVWASDAKSLGEFGDWQAFAYTEDGGKVCYATGTAEQAKGGDKGRKPTILAVTHRAKSHGEVSLIGSYGFKKDADAELQIGAAKNVFFTKGESGWAKQNSADKAIVAALLKGHDATIRATPSKGQAIVDTVTLKGFSKALAAIDKACGVKR